MPNRFEWSEIIIVGLVGGIAAACIGLATLLGASVDNVLNFLGGAMGSGLAVVSTLWLESYRRERALEQMLTSLAIVASVAMRFKNADKNSISPLIITFRQSADAFEASKMGARIPNPLHQYAFQSAFFWLKRALEEMDVAMRDFNSRNIDEDDLLNICRKHSVSIIDPIEDFLKLSGLPKRPLAEFQYYKSKI